MSPICEETAFDLAFVDQWFQIKPHLPLVRDYLSARVENLSLSHAAPESVLQLVKLPEPVVSSESLSAVEKVQELIEEESEPVSVPDVYLPEPKENVVENPFEVDNIEETKRYRYVFIGVAILLVLIFWFFFINTDQNGAPSAQSGSPANDYSVVEPNEIVFSQEESEVHRVADNDAQNETVFSQEPEVPIEPPLVVPIEPPPQPTPVELVRAYYENINEGEADLAISKWKSPNKARLRRLIEGAKWVNINDIHLLSQSADKAEVSVNVTGREKGNTTEEYWAGTIVLEKVGGEWKISKMRLSQI